MKAIELEAVIAKFGSRLSEVRLSSGASITPCEVVSVSAGKKGTLWISAMGEEVFLSVEQVSAIVALP